MRLIDADEVKRDLENWCKEYPEKSESKMLSEQLSEMLVKYLYEKPVFDKCVDAKWILCNPIGGCTSNLKCSRCGNTVIGTWGNFRYCPWCGAKIGEEC